ncbi:hypothetical protein B0I35DRAFT_438176 [Stachybotrys elegans]|uniref:Uncharacterized protein n=1 Tax=Stachybotrys elegans TaxID=80388 RepID=A0A8K0SGD5_9HYPO|nr:hypothetical protein B0I35DRAFT_438176 [Stachybotrys elegans]
MTSIVNILSLLAAIPTPTPAPAPALNPSPDGRECGSVNVFYTGFPPYHPLVIDQGWDPVRVEYGLRNNTVAMVNAGYNVHVVWAGTEVPIPTLEDRLAESGVDFDLLGIGYGIRGATLPPVVERLEDLIDMYHRKLPSTPIVFNYNPESFMWSLNHRLPMREDCEAAKKPGKLIGYEEICDSRCDHEDGSESYKEEL